MRIDDLLWVNCVNCGAKNRVWGRDATGVPCWACNCPVALEWGERPENGVCPWCEQEMPSKN